ncbi:unnamed protein product [Brassica oleracea var. botrytis]
MAKSRRVGWGRHKCVPFNVCSYKARRELRDRTDVGSSAPSSFAAEVKVSLYFLWIYLVMV